MSASQRSKTPRGSSAPSSQSRLPKAVSDYTVNGVRLGDFEEYLNPNAALIRIPPSGYVGHGARHVPQGLGTAIAWFLEEASARTEPLPRNGPAVMYPTALTNVFSAKLWNPLSEGQVKSRLFRHEKVITDEAYEAAVGYLKSKCSCVAVKQVDFLFNSSLSGT